jgi:hypothetical protein
MWKHILIHSAADSNKIYGFYGGADSGTKESDTSRQMGKKKQAHEN